MYSLCRSLFGVNRGGGTAITCSKEVVMYFIQGFFWEVRGGLDVGHDVEGPVVLFKEDVTSVMFSGSIWHLWSKDAPLVGQTYDAFGEAWLMDIRITDEEICFTKQYKRHGSKLLSEKGISYVLRKGEGGTWVGEYSVPPGQKKGPVRCVVTEVDYGLFRSDTEKFASESGFVVKELYPSPVFTEPPQDPEDEKVPF